MGYYDDHSQNRFREQKGNRGGVFLASVVGAILGAILVIIAIPALSNRGFLPYQIDSNENNAVESTNNNNDQNIIQKQVSYDVNTNTTKAVEKAADAVVGINNIQSTSFWSDDQADSEEEAAGTGSGVVYKKAGGKAFVVTNHHVVEGATKLEVSLIDGTKIPAKLLGSDVWTDLAVLEVDADKIKKVAEFGDSDSLKMGEPVIAIGNPLGATFSGSVTQGIISGLKRTIPVDINQDGLIDWNAEVLQTDAAINPGNSGGALINITGQLVGINSMKIAQNAVEGIGLSIPINSARPIIDDLEKFGTVKRPYMGVDLKSVSEIPAYYQEEALKLPRSINYGVALRQVVPNSPAAQAGLQELDVIVEMDGQKINDVIDLRKHLYQKKKIGEQLEIKYYREGKLKQTTLRLAAETTQ
ncbi:trypsin-like peptidase domain-containing protein [Bacillus sp. ISL-40]|uniref:S1C family serine protease n=1 Tax=unclassified Bacillus (in: firmicutes) TaxID=185979 RepID=UPI001BEAD1BF|nr:MULTISPECIES: trypsin-like peptidase domain-containing protein [unclassified Bacillus (in: firmicutes)]MBT2696851.1 trypsin-like peptidase domain-containing protein [Bacillus sp. ISL-40]MBT2719870.1 trypsin-like peptidase domain-containing protein [Bacillus sp. ISL-46]MBT2742545.1 trypsin-like peptidase domain-containing protein [Bacillus sp. ISL-77]